MFLFSSSFVTKSKTLYIGERFQYTYYDSKHGEIWRSIEALDKMGMELIEKMDPADFKTYLREYDNTICGNHPISVLLNVNQTHLNWIIKFNIIFFSN